MCFFKAKYPSHVFLLYQLEIQINEIFILYKLPRLGHCHESEWWEILSESRAS